MYLGRVQQLIGDLKDPTNTSFEGEYNHLELADRICMEYRLQPPPAPTNARHSLTSEMLACGIYFGWSRDIMEALFRPFTIKKDWEQIKLSEVIKVLEDLQVTQRIRWEIVTPTHKKMGSLAIQGISYDPKALERETDEQV